jgi:hypothetical protein
VPVDGIDPKAQYSICMEGWDIGWIFRCAEINLPNVQRVWLDMYSAMRQMAEAVD